MRFHLASRGLLLLLLATLTLSLSAQIPPKPSVPTAVNDYVGLFSERQQRQMESTLVDFAARTSNRIVVLAVPDFGDYSPMEYAVEVGERWGIGSDRFDNGIVLLIKPKTRTPGQVFIAVGYGLEPAIPDGVAKQIVDQQLIPHFKENDYYGGVVAALEVLMPLAAGEITYAEYQQQEMIGELVGVAVLLLLIVGMTVLVMAVQKKHGSTMIHGTGSRTASVADAIFWSSLLNGGHSSHHRGGGFGGGFGGFGGGFGGGSFGGGGAGGSW